MKTLLLPDALREAGVNVKVMDGWEVAHSGGSYKWRETPEDPAGAMWHHTATTAYTPNRDKANGYLGMGDINLDNPRLYQAGGSGRVPIYTLANAQPAPISSGYGCKYVLEDYVKRNVLFEGKQLRSDDTNPQWAGNTHYWNTEVVLDGIGTAMPQDMWDTMVLVAQVLNDVMPGWSPARHIGHGMHTRRKIDLRDGRFPDMAQTIDALRLAMGDNIMGCPWNPNANKGDDWYTDYPKCTSHYDVGMPLEWRTNTGVCAVPSWGETSVDWAHTTGRIVLTDTARDDFTRNLTDGRYWVNEYRAAGSP